MKNGSIFKIIPVVPAAAVIFLLLASVWAYWLVFAYVNTEKNSRDSARADLIAQTERARETEVLEVALEDTKDEREKLRLYAISDSSLVPFFARLESLGAEADVSVHLLSVSEDEKSLVLALEATSTFPHIFHYTRILENLPYKSSLLRTSLDARERGEWHGLYTLVMQMHREQDKPK